MQHTVKPKRETQCRKTGSGIKRQGFTLLEAMFSIAILGVISLLIFFTLKGFMGLWRKEEAKQNLHKKFVKACSALENDLGVSSSRFFSSYTQRKTGEIVIPEVNNSPTDTQEQARWFAFPGFSKDNHMVAYQEKGLRDDKTGLMQIPNNSILWETTVLYYLAIPQKDSCAGWDCCVHKQIIRKEFAFTSTVDGKRAGLYDEYYEGATLMQGPLNGFLITNISPFLTPYSGGSTPQYKERIVEKDIFDIRITDIAEGSISFEMILVRQEDGPNKYKNLNIGTTDFANPNEVARKFIEKIGFTIITKNY